MLDKIIKYDRHRMGSDGKGVSSLVIFPGCPLKCQYCINDYCHDADISLMTVSPKSLFDELKIDDMYFRMTGGGIVFGGGEPILHSDFIEAFSELTPKEWMIRIETSLNCGWDHVEQLIPHIDQWIIDVKDVNPDIYEAYTGLSNKDVLDNIVKLAEAVEKSRIVFRVPLIPGYNSAEDQAESVTFLKQYGEIDVFEYIK